MIDLICSQTDRLLGSLDVDVPAGLRFINFPTDQITAGGFGVLVLQVARFLGDDMEEHPVLLVEPDHFEMLRRMRGFRPQPATH